MRRYPGLAVLLLFSGLLADVHPLRAAGQGDPAAAGAHQRHDAARGWLTLEGDQRAYRDRVGPLGLKHQRQLETIERSQQLDLRAVQQRTGRQIERAERVQRLAPSSNLGTPQIPMRDAAADIRRRIERHRYNIRSQQGWLPFHRR